MRYFLVAAFLCLCGCTQQDRVATGTVHFMRQAREAPTADGGKAVLEESWTETKDQATTKTGFDPAIGNALMATAGVVTKAAAGDWSGAVAGVVGLAVTAAAGYAATQRSKAIAATNRADEHAADAADGWGKFHALAIERGARV